MRRKAGEVRRTKGDGRALPRLAAQVARPRIRLVRGLDDPALRRAGRLVLSIGVYDGVHLGHRRVLETLVREARRLRATPAVLTFDPHPRAFLGTGAPPLITALEHRIALLGAFGARLCIVLPFSPGIAAIDAADFVRGRLLAAADIAGIVVGPRFAFGRRRGGDAALLRRLGGAHGFSVSVAEGLSIGGRAVSSTAIRGLIRRGDLAGATRLLGRPYSLRGTVERGKGIGRTLGVPTANLALEGVLAPPPGVYAARVALGGRVRDGVLNVDPRGAVEVHLFDFRGNLYGRTLEVFFGGRIRAERRFDDPGALARRMQRDIAIAREMLHTDTLHRGGSRARRGGPAAQSLP